MKNNGNACGVEFWCVRMDADPGMNAPYCASSRAYRNVTLVKANVDVRATAPGMLATA